MRVTWEADCHPAHDTSQAADPEYQAKYEDARLAWQSAGQIDVTQNEAALENQCDFGQPPEVRIVDVPKEFCAAQRAEDTEDSTLNSGEAPCTSEMVFSVEELAAAQTVGEAMEVAAAAAFAAQRAAEEERETRLALDVLMMQCVALAPRPQPNIAAREGSSMTEREGPAKDQCQRISRDVRQLHVVPSSPLLADVSDTRPAHLAVAVGGC